MPACPQPSQLHPPPTPSLAPESCLPCASQLLTLSAAQGCSVSVMAPDMLHRYALLKLLYNKIHRFPSLFPLLKLLLQLSPVLHGYWRNWHLSNRTCLMAVINSLLAAHASILLARTGTATSSGRLVGQQNREDRTGEGWRHERSRRRLHLVQAIRTECYPLW